MASLPGACRCLLFLLLLCRHLRPRHQPLAVLFLLPPSEALEIFLFTGPGTQYS